MPRLLLVDDNPSIHKIAETLLATTPIELVCVDSAAAALDKVGKGEHFDVALVDTSMADMDGWELLGKLRELPATARMPIAMMAGVLDTVDPDRIKEAPIQGFFKKPVELRELGDRITKLLETPVMIPEPPPPPPREASPFATMPAVRIDELPEFRKKAEAVSESLDDVLELTEEDLYPEPAAAVPTEAETEESLDLEELDLESLRGLSVEPAAPAPAPMAAYQPFEEVPAPTPESILLPAEQLDAISTLDRLPALPEAVTAESVPEAELEIAGVELPDLGPAREDLLEISSLSHLPEFEELETTEQAPAMEIPLAALLEESREEAAFIPPLPPLEESLDWSDDSESMLAVVESPAPVSQAEAAEAVAAPEEELDLLDVSISEVSVGAGVEAPTLQLDVEENVAQLPAVEEKTDVFELPEVVVPPIPIFTQAPVEPMVPEPVVASAPEPVAMLEPAPSPLAPLSSSTSKELLDAMMADPALMDALAKAVVARLGDQVLREIAWEVIPELAERLPRN